LSTTNPSTAEAWVSMDGHLLQLAGTVQGGSYTAHGVIRQENCNTTVEPSHDRGG